MRPNCVGTGVAVTTEAIRGGLETRGWLSYIFEYVRISAYEPAEWAESRGEAWHELC